MFYSTKDAAKRLQIQPDRLQKAIWLGRIDPPLKSPSGNFLWTERDIEKAAWALHRSHLLAGASNEH